MEDNNDGIQSFQNMLAERQRRRAQNVHKHNIPYLVHMNDGSYQKYDDPKDLYIALQKEIDLKEEKNKTIDQIITVATNISNENTQLKIDNQDLKNKLASKEAKIRSLIEQIERYNEEMRAMRELEDPF